MEPHWYALKVFYNKIKPIREEAEADGVSTFIPMCIVEQEGKEGLEYVEKQVISSLLFVHCTPEWLRDLKKRHLTQLMWYSDPGDEHHLPAPIPDGEMKSFMIVTSGGGPVEYLGSTITELHRGQKVRVTGGVYKGAEGYIKRVRRNRKFLVAISGIAVVAVSYIHPSYLEPID